MKKIKLFTLFLLTTVGSYASTNEIKPEIETIEKIESNKTVCKWAIIITTIEGFMVDAVANNSDDDGATCAMKFAAVLSEAQETYGDSGYFIGYTLNATNQ